MATGQERAGAARVITRAIRAAGQVREAREDHHIRAVGSERLKDGRQRELRAFGHWRERGHVNTAGHEVPDEPPRNRTLSARGRGDHGLEQRQRDEGAGTLEERTTRERLQGITS